MSVFSTRVKNSSFQGQPHTFYKWLAKFGGMEASDAKRLRELGAENARLKKLLAEAALEGEALKVAFGVKR